MPTEADPIVGNWYAHLDKGQRFFVTAVDEEAGTVEVQHFDGDLEEFTLDNWYALDVEPAEEPENWGGALDIAELDDFGTEITDTSREDWGEAENEFGPETLRPRQGRQVEWEDEEEERAAGESGEGAAAP